MNTSKGKRKKSRLPPVSPEEQLLLEELCEMLQRLGREVRREEGNFKGGICLLDEHPVFFINKNLPASRNIDLIIEYLRTQDISHLFIPPKLRAKIEDIELNIEALP